MSASRRRLPLLASAVAVAAVLTAHAAAAFNVDIAPRLTAAAAHRDVHGPSPTPTEAPLALITAAPERRATAGASVIGYYPYGKSWGTASCASGLTFVTSDGYGGCCDGPGCLYATACAGADFVGIGGSGGSCGQGNTCITYTVRWATDSPTSVFWLGCSVPPNPPVPETLYRTAWQLVTTTPTRTSTRTSTKPTTFAPPSIDFTLPLGFTLPTIAPPPTFNGPPNWSTTFAPIPFPCQAGPCLGDDGPATPTTTKGGAALGGGGSAVPGAGAPRSLDRVTGLLAAGVAAVYGLVAMAAL
ncbi:hypothetical protein MN608_04266 [Microdochium nivale]|nr:hypothetical protein MN608_04266 [Microdochium nivale]